MMVIFFCESQYYEFSMKWPLCFFYVFNLKKKIGPNIRHFETTFVFFIIFQDIPSLRWETPVISSPKPKGRRSHSSIAVDGNLLIFGGYNGHKREHMNDLWLLDTSNWTWSQIKPSGIGPDPRRRQALCQVVRMLIACLLDWLLSVYVDLHFWQNSLLLLHSGPENIKKSGPKNSWN